MDEEAVKVTASACATRASSAGSASSRAHGAVGLDPVDLPALLAQSVGMVDGAWSAQGNEHAPGTESRSWSGKTSISPAAQCSAGTRSGSTPPMRRASARGGSDRGHQGSAERTGVAQLAHEAVHRVGRGEDDPVVVGRPRPRRPAGPAPPSLGPVWVVSGTSIDPGAGPAQGIGQTVGPRARPGHHHRAAATAGPTRSGTARSPARPPVR